MNGGRRMDENKQFPQLYYTALEYFLIMHNAIYSKHTWSGDISSFSRTSVCIICEKWWLSESYNTGCCSNLCSLGGTVVRSYLHSYYMHFIRLLTLDPIRGTEQAALNYMNTNVFSRRPREILNVRLKTSFFNLMIENFKSNLGEKKNHSTFALRAFLFEDFLTRSHHSSSQRQSTNTACAGAGIKLGLKIQAWCLTQRGFIQYNKPNG